MKKILLTLNVLSLMIYSYADDTGGMRLEVVRPSVFIIIRDIESVRDSIDSINDFVPIIQSAVRKLSNSERAIMPKSVENIVLIEENTSWLVAFFQKGNGRIAIMIDNKVHSDGVVRLNPKVIKISKGTLVAEECKNAIALPWPMSVPLKLETKYDDMTLAEKEEGIKLEAKLGIGEK